MEMGNPFERAIQRSSRWSRFARFVMYVFAIAGVLLCIRIEVPKRLLEPSILAPIEVEAKAGKEVGAGGWSKRLIPAHNRGVARHMRRQCRQTQVRTKGAEYVEGTVQPISSGSRQEMKTSNSSSSGMKPDKLRSFPFIAGWRGKWSKWLVQSPARECWGEGR